jgi:ubiquitin-like modifier-activating enzyme ATG7
VEAYNTQGFDFLLQAFNSPSYLEDITGLTKMKQEAEELKWEVAEDDDF